MSRRPMTWVLVCCTDLDFTVCLFREKWHRGFRVEYGAEAREFGVGGEGLRLALAYYQDCLRHAVELTGILDYS